MKRKIFSLIGVFIFIFSFVGCKCKKEEEVKVETYIVPMSVAYLDKNIDGRYTVVYPFNTQISLRYFYKSDFDKVGEYFEDEFTRMHSLFDRHYYYFDKDGNLINNLRIINESNGNEVSVDQDLIDIFNEGIRFTKLSNGKFNIGVGNLSDLWDSFIELGNINQYKKYSELTKYSYENNIYSENENGEYISLYGIYVNTSHMKKYNFINEEYVEDENGEYLLVKNIAPSEEQIRQAMLCTPSVNNIEDIIVVNDQNNTIRINKIDGCNSAVTITLGALAKSYATEKIASHKDIKDGDFLINAGQSTIKIIGENLSKETKDWTIGITNSHLTYKDGIDRISRNRSDYANFSIKIEDSVSVSTSSGDEKHYFYNDKYYHHIIDPNTGYPTQTRFAVTVLTDNAMYADIATTAMMSMNMEETKEFLRNLKEERILLETYIQEKDSSGVKVYVSENTTHSVDKRIVEGLEDYINNIVIEEFSYDS